MKEDTAKNLDGSQLGDKIRGKENEKWLIVLGQSPKPREHLSCGHLYLCGLEAWGHKLLAGLKLQGSLQLITQHGAQQRDLFTVFIKDIELRSVFHLCSGFFFPSLSYPIGDDICDQVAGKLMENNDSVLLDWPVGRD